MLKIESLKYSERFFESFSRTNHYWKLERINLSDFTILAGLNASGKTRVCNVIMNTIARILQPKKDLDIGNREIEFRTAKNRYKLILNVEQAVSFQRNSDR